MPDIWFPYLGIEIQQLSKTAFSIGSFSVAWYGIIIALGVVAGLLMARHLAKKSGQDPDMYTDFLIYALIFSLIGARIYYVIFEWDLYKNDIASIFNLRLGGLGIYGGVIAAIITALIYCKIKKKSVLELMDTAMPGLILGQAIGRWGNFFNQEAFGGYTDTLFAMRLNVDTAAYTTSELLQHAVTKGGVRYIQVHPTFLYESVCCLVILAIMLILFKHRKFKGEIAFTYMIGYGIARAFIETLRTDQLLLWNTQFPVSVLTSAVFAVSGIILMIVFGSRARIKKTQAAMTTNEFAPEIEEETDLTTEILSADDDTLPKEETQSKEDNSSKEETPTEGPLPSEGKKETKDDLWS